MINSSLRKEPSICQLQKLTKSALLIGLKKYWGIPQMYKNIAHEFMLGKFG